MQECWMGGNLEINKLQNSGVSLINISFVPFVYALMGAFAFITAHVQFKHKSLISLYFICSTCRTLSYRIPSIRTCRLFSGNQRITVALYSLV